MIPSSTPRTWSGPTADMSSQSSHTCTVSCSIAQPKPSMERKLPSSRPGRVGRCSAARRCSTTHDRPDRPSRIRSRGVAGLRRRGVVGLDDPWAPLDAVTNPKHILIVVQNLPVPFDRRVWLECQELKDAGYEVSVVCPKGPGDPALEVDR